MADVTLPTVFTPAASSSKISQLALLQFPTGEELIPVVSNGKNYLIEKKEISSVPADSGPTVYGPSSIYATLTGTYQITNYDFPEVYSVTVSQGTISFNPEDPSLFTVTAPSTAGSLVLTVNNKTYPITVKPLQVITPSITLPTAGATVSCDTVMLVGSQYFSPLNSSADAASAISGIDPFGNAIGTAAYNTGLPDPQVSSTWQIATDSNFTTIVDQGTNSSPLFTQFLSKGLSLNTTYYARVMYGATTSAPSAWSATLTFTTGNLCYPTAEVYETLSPTSNTYRYSYDWFGNALATTADGNTLVVADPKNSDQLYSSVYGSLRIFNTGTFPYTLKQTLSNPSSSSNFGYALDMTADGQYIAVTIPDSAAPVGSTNVGTGSFLIYSLQAGQYVLIGTYTAPLYASAITTRNFGQSIKFSRDGTRLFVSDGVNNTNPNTTTYNSVYCYSMTGGVPTLIATIADPGYNGQFGATFGLALSVSSDGRTFATSSTTFKTAQNGVAYVYHDTTGGQTPTFNVIPVPPATAWAAATNSSSFGSSVSLSADLSYLAVGAPLIVNPTNTSYKSGTVFIYNLNLASLLYTDNNITISTNTSAYESFGFEVYFGQTPNYLYILGADLYLYSISATPTLIDTLSFTNLSLNGNLNTYQGLNGTTLYSPNLIAASQTDNRVYVGNTGNSGIMTTFNGSGIIGEFACFNNPTYTPVSISGGGSGSSGLV